MQPDSWILTEEEWHELCGAFMELSTAHDHLQTILLADHTPSLQALWQATTNYKSCSQAFFQALSKQLRARIDRCEQQTNPS